MRILNKNRKQYFERLVTKLNKVTDVYEDESLNEVFAENIDASIYSSVRNYWAKAL